MSDPEWRIRSGRRDDAALLDEFSCADQSIHWQVEVEQFVQAQLIDWTFDPHATDADPRLLLGFLDATGELFGVAAHEEVVLEGDSSRFHATKLQVIALAAAWQGRRFQSGVRPSDVLMSAVMTDISARTPPRTQRVFAVIHEENQRSIALCRRHGLIAEMSRPHPQYRRLTTG